MKQRSFGSWIHISREAKIKLCDILGLTEEHVCKHLEIVIPADGLIEVKATCFVTQEQAEQIVGVLAEGEKRGGYDPLPTHITVSEVPVKGTLEWSPLSVVYEEQIGAPGAVVHKGVVSNERPEPSKEVEVKFREFL